MDENELLQVNNVSYDRSLFSSLRDVSFSVNKGESVVLFGPENSGLNMVPLIIAGIEENFSGTVFFKGQNVCTSDVIRKNTMRQQLVYLPRNYGLISNMSVEENIALPLRYHSQLSEDEVRARVDMLVDELQLDYCRDLRPVNLMQFEILKTAYARAIALDPDLLIVDHALEGQCLLNALTFMSQLKARCDNSSKTTVISTYEPERFF